MWFMYRSKRTAAMLLGLVMTISLSGCDAQNLFTDAGSGKQQEIPKEEYLMTEVLEEQQDQTMENMYNVLTLTKGNFEEEAMKQILKQSYINVPTVRFDLDGIKATFGEYVAEYYQYVKEGDVIATVYTSVDEIALEEAKMKLQRLEERYQTAKERVNEDLQKISEDKHFAYDDHKSQLLDIDYRQRQLDWEREKEDYETKIADAKEELQKLNQVGSVYEVKAPMDGYVSYSRKHSAGKEMKEGDYICHIMNSNVIYATTDSPANQFHYGMTVVFDNTNGLTPGIVVSGGSWALHGNLDTRRTIFRLAFEQDVSELDSTGLNNLVLKGNLKEMKNVIMIPKKAVTVEENEYFVTVLEEDGSLLKTEFIPGGSNVENYWVLKGLTEGMKIVYH